MPKYINPYTDFGFKKLFGEEANKDLLIDFLNQLLPPNHQIAELSFKNNENIPDLPFERKAIFDIHCKATSGEHFIVEMQKAKMDFFKDRALFYATFPIRDQAKKGLWDFQLLPIYMIAILDFKYDEEVERQKFFRHVQLRDQDNDIFFENLHFKFIQMPLFTKEEHELETHFDKWIYFLKKLETFDDIPQILKEPIFEKAFKSAEIANFTADQRDQYEFSRIGYLEIVALKNQAEAAEKRAEAAIIEAEKRAEEKAKAEIAREKNEIAREMKANGEPISKIKKYTGLSDSEIEQL